MRKLWEDHITWTRLHIVSAATLPDALPDLGPTAERLLANQDDLGDSLRPFYRHAVGDAVTGLLRERILIAAALSGLDPEHWPLDHMQAMLKAHLDRTLEEAVARLEGRYADDIAAYEAIHAVILAMADMLSDAIIARFPNRFRG